jgi:hypothetical protein
VQLSVASLLFAAIRVASQWYQHHLGAAKVLLLTNDNDNRRKAREDGIVAETGTFVFMCWCVGYMFSIRFVD